MRPIFVLNTLDERDGGPPTGVCTLATQLARDGHSPRILCLERRGVAETPLAVVATHAGVDIVRIPLGRFSPVGWCRLALTARREFSRADVVSIHGFYLMVAVIAASVSHRLHIPYVIQPHGVLDGYQDRFSSNLKGVFRTLVGRRMLRNAKSLILATEDEVRNLSLYARITPTAVVGISVPDLQQPMSSFGGRKIVFVGRVAAKKRLDRLIRAVAMLRDAGFATDLTIAGAGDQDLISQLRGLVEELDLRDRVRWTGHISGSAKFQLLGNSTVFCLPSERENFAITVAESCSVGLPVVVTDEVATSRYIREVGAGCVLEDASPEAIAAAIRRLMSEEHLWLSAHTGALALSKRTFSTQAVAERWLDSVERASRAQAQR